MTKWDPQLDHEPRDSKLWPAYRKRYNWDEKPLRAWLASHGYKRQRTIDLPTLAKWVFILCAFIVGVIFGRMSL